MKRWLLTVFSLLATASLAHAHFVFVVPETGGGTAKVVISEELKPDGEVDFSLVSGAKLTLRSADGKETPLTLVKAQDSFTVSLSGTGLRVIHGVDDLGLSQNAADKPYLLLYHPKTILGNAFDTKSALGADAPVELIPHGKPGALTLELVAHGKPQPNAEVTVILPDGTQKKVKTDAAGKTETFTAVGRYGAWARFWEPGSGEREGKKYDEVRHYATLVFDAKDSSITAKHFATLPEATSAFGSVTSDGWLYVYGGHVSPTHTYSTAAVSGNFFRLNLAKPDKWESLAGGQSLQGMNLAAYEGKIYLIGGMSPRNKPGSPSDTHSVVECARFDPATKKWEPLPPLPEARSSHDVVVLDGKLIVTGGWDLRGKEEDWAETLAVLDLKAPKLAWTSFKQPFKLRALMAAAYMGKM